MKFLKNNSICDDFSTKIPEKFNKTFDFPSKDEEILYNIINQEYQTIFNINSTKARKITFPNIDDYLKNAKHFQKEKLMKKTQKIQSKCSEISKKLEKNLFMLKVNFEQKKKNQENQAKKFEIYEEKPEKTEENQLKFEENEIKFEENALNFQENAKKIQYNEKKNENLKKLQNPEKIENDEENLENNRENLENESLKEKACLKIQIFWRFSREKHEKTLKNVLNICQTSLYQKNKAKILQKRVLLSPQKKKLKKFSKKTLDFRKKKPEFLKKTMKKPGDFSLKILDSFSSSKLKNSINSTLNFKEINENSKSLITIRDFNSRSIEREELSKPTPTINDRNITKNPEYSEKSRNYERINEENSENFDENADFSQKNLNGNFNFFEEKPDLFPLKKFNEKTVFFQKNIKNSKKLENSKKKSISDKILTLMELSSKYQEELCLVKANFVKKFINEDVSHAADKFFSLIKKQCDLNKKILLENFKLNQAISSKNEASFHQKNPQNPLKNFTIFNEENAKKQLKNKVNSNLKCLRAAFGSEKLLKEASNSLNLHEKLKENPHIFEEDSFRNFTNRKILEFLSKENIVEIPKIKEIPLKKKPKSCDSRHIHDKNNFALEKWVTNEKNKLKKSKKFNNLGCDLPKVSFLIDFLLIF